MNTDSNFFRTFGHFLLGERVSLKVVFDNVRNTIIAATLISGGIWIKGSSSSPFSKLPASKATLEFLEWFPTLLIGVGLSLLALNMMQALVISRRGAASFNYPHGDSAESKKKLPWSVEILLFLVLALLQLATVVVVPLFMFRVLAGGL